MDIMSSIASTSTAYSQAQLATDYSMSLTKKMMDTTEELALKELEQMLPPSPYTFDVYA
ncbi:MAG: putative motility protein [Acutalibacter sp.]|jgi:hypothetical protein|nr:putative motility protein [Acutalibacter sp.]